MALAFETDWDPPIHYGVLGGFRCHHGDRVVAEEAWGGELPARVLRFLLTRAGEQAPEGSLIEALMPWGDPVEARAELDAAISRLRMVLNPPGAPESRIEGSGGTVALRLRPGDGLDARTFLDAVDAALAPSAPPRPELIEHALDLWGGEPLPTDRGEPWAEPFRATLLERYGALIEARQTAQAGSQRTGTGG